MNKLNINSTINYLYSEYLVNRLGLLTETYRDTAIIKIFFEYAVRDSLASDDRKLLAKLLMYSLYGKFGMKSESATTELYDSTNDLQMKTLECLLADSGETIQDLYQIGKYYLLQSTKLSYKYNEKEDIYHGLDVNIAIAATITAGARCHMSSVKNQSDMQIYYSDTDSIITNKPLDPEFVGDKLGQFKLECIIKRAVFLAPKVYGLITDTGEQIIKVKGLTKETVEALLLLYPVIGS